jgi:hypothetical protein
VITGTKIAPTLSVSSSDRDAAGRKDKFGASLRFGLGAGQARVAFEDRGALLEQIRPPARSTWTNLGSP